MSGRLARSVSLVCCVAVAALAQAPQNSGFTGRVVDEAGAPIAGAAVAALDWVTFVDTAKLLATAAARTDAAGAFVLDGDRAVRCVVTAPGRQSVVVSLGAVADGRRLPDVVLPPAVQLIGRVRDGEGKPLGGARVRVESSLVDRYAHQHLLAGALSSDKGVFVVPGVPRTGLRIVVEADGYRRESRLVAQESPLDLVLTRVGMVRGRVVDAAGQPIAGATVSAVVACSDPGQQTRSAADGSFALTVPGSGCFRLSAHLPQPPWRMSSSGLLHGPQDDVVVTEASASASAPAGTTRRITVTAVDAATGAAIEPFQFAPVHTDPTNLQTVLFHHRGALQPGQGEAVLEFDDAAPARAVLVEAAGHGFAVVPIPETGERLRVELGPEAVLVGEVRDEETGKPIAGVAVRALPTGRASGSGGLPGPPWPITDANGAYRMTGLQPGDYQVQVHALDRSASPPSAVTLRAGEDTRLDLAAPRRRWIEVAVTGDPPPGATVFVRVGNARFSGRGAGGFEHYVPQPQPVLVRGPGTVRFGPLGSGRRNVELFVPSRLRAAAGTTVDLGVVEADGAALSVDLAKYRIATLRGVVELPSDVASERVGVLASQVTEERRIGASAPRPGVAGLDGGHRFEMDLLLGVYCLQLVDLETGIVFHTEEQDLEIDARPVAVTLRPAVHWLELECKTAGGGEVALHSFGVTLVPPRDGAVSPFVDNNGGSNRQMHGSVPFRCGAARQRWLVPAGPMTIKALQMFDALRPFAGGWGSQEVANHDVDIADREHHLELQVPPIPTDEELRKR